MTERGSEKMNGAITKAWTYGVAYLSLAVGSGVSIAGNIADTYRVATATARAVDTLDIVISAFWPAAVLLAIEMFVSSLWPRTVAMQVVRWLGSLAIGFVAMYVSWHHLADLLSSRGQDSVVSWLGPLAIDGLAIMATGLILSSRGQLATVADVANEPVAMDSLANQLATGLAEQRAVSAVLGLDTAMATQPMDPEWTSADQAMLDAWDRDMDTLETAVPVSPAPALARSNEVKPESVPATARDLFAAWAAAPRAERPGKIDMCTLVGAEHAVSARTARRWYDAVSSAPWWVS